MLPLVYFALSVFYMISYFSDNSQVSRGRYYGHYSIEGNLTRGSQTDTIEGS